MKKLERFPDEIGFRPVTLIPTTLPACSMKYESVLMDYYWNHVLATRKREWKPDQWFYCQEWSEWEADDAWLLRDALYHRRHRAKDCADLTFLFVDLEGVCWSWQEAPLPY
jgi:hypothetical protein